MSGPYSQKIVGATLSLKSSAGEAAAEAVCSRRPACPVCNGPLLEIRAKFQCSICHRICETCCEGGQG